MSILYEVNAAFIDPSIADDWVRWMVDEHISDVIEAGASSGRLLRVDSEDGSPRYSVLYEFASRDRLDAYVRDHADRLRAEGVRQFPLDKVRYHRRTGEFVG